jgi:hypothetical protein
MPITVPYGPWVYRKEVNHLQHDQAGACKRQRTTTVTEKETE